MGKETAARTRAIHYCSKVWGHLEMSLILKEKQIFLSVKIASK